MRADELFNRFSEISWWAENYVIDKDSVEAYSAALTRFQELLETTTEGKIHEQLGSLKDIPLWLPQLDTISNPSVLKVILAGLYRGGAKPETVAWLFPEFYIYTLFDDSFDDTIDVAHARYYYAALLLTPEFKIVRDLFVAVIDTLYKMYIERRDELQQIASSMTYVPDFSEYWNAIVEAHGAFENKARGHSYAKWFKFASQTLDEPELEFLKYIPGARELVDDLQKVLEDPSLLSEKYWREPQRVATTPQTKNFLKFQEDTSIAPEDFVKRYEGLIFPTGASLAKYFSQKRQLLADLGCDDALLAKYYSDIARVFAEVNKPAFSENLDDDLEEYHNTIYERLMEIDQKILERREEGLKELEEEEAQLKRLGTFLATQNIELFAKRLNETELFASSTEINEVLKALREDLAAIERVLVQINQLTIPEIPFKLFKKIDLQSKLFNPMTRDLSELLEVELPPYIVHALYDYLFKFQSGFVKMIQAEAVLNLFELWNDDFLVQRVNVADWFRVVSLMAEEELLPQALNILDWESPGNALADFHALFEYNDAVDYLTNFTKWFNKLVDETRAAKNSLVSVALTMIQRLNQPMEITPSLETTLSNLERWKHAVRLKETATHLQTSLQALVLVLKLVRVIRRAVWEFVWNGAHHAILEFPSQDFFALLLKIPDREWSAKFHEFDLDVLKSLIRTNELYEWFGLEYIYQLYRYLLNEISADAAKELEYVYQMNSRDDLSWVLKLKTFKTSPEVTASPYDLIPGIAELEVFGDG